MGLNDLTPYQKLRSLGCSTPQEFCLFPTLILDHLVNLPEILNRPKSVQEHLDYDLCVKRSVVKNKIKQQFEMDPAIILFPVIKKSSIIKGEIKVAIEVRIKLIVLSISLVIFRIEFSLEM
jgi:hypothetical protein